MINILISAIIVSAQILWASASQSAPIQISTPPPVSKTAAPAQTFSPPSVPQALTPSMIYVTSNLRDPFRAASSGGSIVRKDFKLSDFNIHNLILRGLIIDPPSSDALLIDSNYGESFILRGNRVFTVRGKLVLGISGHLDAKRKTVYLKARDGDVQVLRMGLKKR